MKKLGMEAKLYYDATPITVNAAAGSWTELSAARDVTTNMDKAEADVTTRANAGWRATRGALRDASVDFELVWDPDDTGIEAIREAYMTNSVIALAIMDGDCAVAGSEGFAANFEVTSFNRSEPLEDAVTVSVTAKPASFHEWWEVAS